MICSIDVYEFWKMLPPPPHNDKKILNPETAVDFPRANFRQSFVVRQIAVRAYRPGIPWPADDVNIYGGGGGMRAVFQCARASPYHYCRCCCQRDKQVFFLMIDVVFGFFFSATRAARNDYIHTVESWNKWVSDYHVFSVSFVSLSFVSIIYTCARFPSVCVTTNFRSVFFLLIFLFANTFFDGQRRYEKNASRIRITRPFGLPPLVSSSAYYVRLLPDNHVRTSFIPGRWVNSSV